MYLSLLVVVVTLVIIKWFMRKRASIHGYHGVPVLGILPFLDANPAVTFVKWSKKLGPVFRVKMGMQDAVVLNDYESMKECLSTKGRYSSDRIQLGVMESARRGHGIGFRDRDAIYTTTKKVITTFLKRFIGDTSSLEDKVNEKLTFLFNEIDSYDGKSFNVKGAITKCYASIICYMLFGEGFGWKILKVDALLEAMNNIFNNQKENSYINFLMMFDWLKWFPPFTGVFKRFDASYTRQHEIIRDAIKKIHKETNNRNCGAFVQTFLANKEADQENQAFEDDEILSTIVDLFNAGIDTISVTTVWGLLYLVQNEDTQDKIFNEIQNHIGDGTPMLKYMKEMPFTCSFLEEVSRHRTIFPTSLYHKASRDITVSNIKVPMGSMIIANTWGVHHSSKYFDEPDKMIPDRFIEKSSGKFVKSPYVIPFGIGLRKCPGYQLVEKELFLVFCSILQRYKLVKDKNSVLPDFNDGVAGFIYFTKPYSICFVRRN